jgi:predicted Na+-dependent transporter
MIYMSEWQPFSFFLSAPGQVIGLVLYLIYRNLLPKRAHKLLLLSPSIVLTSILIVLLAYLVMDQPTHTGGDGGWAVLAHLLVLMAALVFLVIGVPLNLLFSYLLGRLLGPKKSP